MSDVLGTSVGDFEVGAAFDVRTGHLDFTLDRFVNGVVEDVH